MSATEIGTDRTAAAEARIAERDEARRAAVTASFRSDAAEVAILGSMMLDPDAAKALVHAIDATDFFDRARGEVFVAMSTATLVHGIVDIVTVAEELRRRGVLERLGGAEYLSRLVAETPSAANALAYARIVKRHAAQRRLREAAEGLRLALTEEAARAAAERVREAAEGVTRAERSDDAVDGAPLDAADIMNLEDPPESPMFVEYLIARPAVAIVFGSAQSGKSWALMNACMDLIGGGGCFVGADHLQIVPLSTKFGGAPDVVLWVYGSEDTPARVQSRMRTSWRNGPHAAKPLPPKRFFAVAPPGGMSLATPEGIRWLREQADSVAATVIVLDTIFSLCGSTMDTSKSEEVMPFMIAMQSMRNSNGGRVVLLVHHPRKSSGDAKQNATESKGDKIMGSSVWRAQCDAMVFLESADGRTGGVVHMQSIKAKDIPKTTPRLRVTLEEPSGRFRELEETEEPPAPTLPPRGPGRPRTDRVAPILDAIAAGRVVRIDNYDCAELLDVSASWWRTIRKSVQKELLDKGVCVVGGELRRVPDEAAAGGGQDIPDDVPGEVF